MPMQRMRVRKGRVMHLVDTERTTGSGMLRSQCTKPHPVKGVQIRLARAQGRPDEWSTQRFWYPDCAHCQEPPSAS